jgi:hypothetical protein
MQQNTAVRTLLTLLQAIAHTALHNSQHSEASADVASLSRPAAAAVVSAAAAAAALPLPY